MNTFNKSFIEKNILDIKLSNKSYFCDCNRKHNTDSGSFDNWTESVSVVQTRNLSITFGNKTSLETLDGSIKQIFNTKHPFKAHETHLKPMKLVLGGRVTKVQVSFCRKARISSSMVATQAGFLATDLNPFDSVDARRVERCPDEPKISRFAGWRVLNILVLAHVIIG